MADRTPIDQGLDDAIALATWLRDSERASGAVAAIARHLADCLRAGGRVLTCGNGGSLCDAMHFAEEMSGRFRNDRPALAVQAMADPSHLTCVANDYGFDRVFARGVEAWGKAGDALIVFSTSGKSPNLIAAVEAARARAASTAAIRLGLLPDVENTTSASPALPHASTPRANTRSNP